MDLRNSSVPEPGWIYLRIFLNEIVESTYIVGDYRLNRWAESV